MAKKNKNIGAKVLVREVLLDISPKVKWRKLKNVGGVIVENKGYEQYYHTCSGCHTYKTKHLIDKDVHATFAIKLDNDVKDIEGNNVIIVRDFDLKFLETIETLRKPVSEKSYLAAKRIVELYKLENKIL